MGLAYAEIELMNAGDLAMVRRHIIGGDEIKRITVTMLSGSGAYMMAINKTIQEQLDLPFIEKRKVLPANGGVEEYDVVGPVTVKFKNRTAVCSAMVLRGDTEPLLGAIAMDDIPVPLPYIRLLP